MILTEKERKIIYDQEFLLTKLTIIKKIENLFEEIRLVLNNSIVNSKMVFPSHIDIKYGKIFRGENYNSLPYVTLDYPKHFSGEDTFTFRTMFWWGNFLSATFHLEGKSLEKYRDKLCDKASSLLNHNIYICVNKTQWEYHYDESNYQLLTEKNQYLLENEKFIKLSKKYSIDDIDKLPSLVNNFFIKMLNVLAD